MNQPKGSPYRIESLEPTLKERFHWVQHPVVRLVSLLFMALGVFGATVDAVQARHERDEVLDELRFERDLVHQLSQELNKSTLERYGLGVAHGTPLLTSSGISVVDNGLPIGAMTTKDVKAGQILCARKRTWPADITTSVVTMEWVWPNDAGACPDTSK
jgi:hypothetical protein